MACHCQSNTRLQHQEPGFALTSLYLYLVAHCNLSCAHCWISPAFSSYHQDGIPFDALRRTISEAKALGLQNVKLTGGEPLLYRDIGKLLGFLGREKVDILIETNGTLIDREMVDRFADCHVEQISVSLDGATEEVHDEIRGVEGSYRRTLKGLQLLSEYGLSFQIIMTLQRKNRHEIEGVMRLSRDVGANSLKINHLLPCGRGRAAFKHRMNLEFEELIQLYQMVEKNRPEPDDLDIVFDLPLAFRSIKDIKTRGICECHILNILGILANGDFSICGVGQTVEELRMGNICRDPVSEVWKNNATLRKLRMSLPWKLKGICGECIFKFQCLGACRANAYTLTQDLYAPYFLCEKFDASGLFPASRNTRES